MAARFVAVLAIGGFIGPTSALAHPLDDLQPGEWFEVPNSHLAAVAPCPQDFCAYQPDTPPCPANYCENNPGDPQCPAHANCPYSGVEGVAAVMDDWSGGAFDTKRERLIVWGGGHQGYGGNELYAFDVESLQWVRLTNPSSLVGFEEDADTMPDGLPKSIHTYDQVEYAPEPFDAFFATMGSAWNQGGGSRTTWLFRFNTMQWERQPDAPGQLYNDFIDFASTSAYDAATGKVLMWGGYYTADFDLSTQSWTKHSSWEYQNLGRTGAFDSKRRAYVSIGRSQEHVFQVDGSGDLGASEPLGSSGGSAVVSDEHPGLVYDSHSDRIVAWAGGQNVYSLDMDTRVWTTHAATNSVDPGTPNMNGTLGRFRYMPARNAFILVNHAKKNVYFYKLTPGQPAPDPSALASPESLSVR